MRKNLPIETKNAAIELRKKGGSIGAIATSLGVSKSTVYEWTKNMEGAARFAEIGRNRWIKELQPLGAQGQRRKRELKIQKIIQAVNEELLNFTPVKEIEKAMLAMLYWSEGSKGRGMLVFANTDPRLMLLFITLLRNCYSLDESKFRVRIHIHWYHNEKRVKQYWSELLKIPQSQFTKTYHKKRSKEKVFRKNIGGICFLIYNSDYLREQIVHYSYALGERIVKK
jgi:transposase-like protein